MAVKPASAQGGAPQIRGALIASILYWQQRHPRSKSARSILALAFASSPLNRLRSILAVDFASSSRAISRPSSRSAVSQTQVGTPHELAPGAPRRAFATSPALHPASKVTSIYTHIGVPFNGSANEGLGAVLLHGLEQRLPGRGQQTTSRWSHRAHRVPGMRVTEAHISAASSHSSEICWHTGTRSHRHAGAQMSIHRAYTKHTPHMSLLATGAASDGREDSLGVFFQCRIPPCIRQLKCPCRLRTRGRCPAPGLHCLTISEWLRQEESCSLDTAHLQGLRPSAQRKRRSVTEQGLRFPGTPQRNVAKRRGQDATKPCQAAVAHNLPRLTKDIGRASIPSVAHGIHRIANGIHALRRALEQASLCARAPRACNRGHSSRGSATGSRLDVTMRRCCRALCGAREQKRGETKRQCPRIFVG